MLHYTCVLYRPAHAYVYIMDNYMYIHTYIVHVCAFVCVSVCLCARSVQAATTLPMTGNSAMGLPSPMVRDLLQYALPIWLGPAFLQLS